MSDADTSARRRFLDNPFHVLGLPKSATRAEVEREGQKLLGMLELGLSSARTYATPVGPGERDATLVRHAMAELRDPDRRLLHELWAWSSSVAEASPTTSTPPAPSSAARPVVRRWPDALRVLGFGRGRAP